MSSKYRKYSKCVYDKCAIPDNNNCYIWQLGFIVFGIAGFAFKGNDFSFFNVFLFLFPILLDMFYNDVRGKLVVAKYFYIALDVICMLICFAGITMFDENGISVHADTLYLGLVDISLIKGILLWVLIINVPVPVIFYVARPCKKTAKTVERVLKINDDLRREEKAC